MLINRHFFALIDATHSNAVGFNPTALMEAYHAINSTI